MAGVSERVVAHRERSPAIAFWFLPDAAMLVALVAIFQALLLGDGPSKFFRDSDTGWHIRNGEALLNGASFPRTDPYSFSRQGEPWYAWEWGADVIMGMAHRLDGLRGVAMLYALVASCAVWLWFRLHRLTGGNLFLAFAMASPLLTTLNLHWLARPHVFGWLFCVMALAGMELALRRDKPRFRIADGAIFFVGGALWANVHASFLFLPALCLLYAAGAFVQRWIWSDPRPASWFLYAAGMSLSGTFVNPYGWSLHTHVLSYLSNNELLARIGEFQSFNFHAQGSTQILATLMIAAVGVPLMLAGRPRPEHFLLAIAMLFMSLRSARALPLLALLCLPLVNGAVTRALWQAHIGARARRMVDAFLSYSVRVERLDGRCGGFALAPIVLLLILIALHAPAVSAQTGFPAKEFPVEAAAAVAKLPSGARILAPDKFGGYLIYRFRGERKVFFDGRSDFYGVEFMKDYIRLIEARPGWRGQVLRHGFDYALLPNNYSLVDGLQHWGWQVVHRDATATLLRK